MSIVITSYNYERYVETTIRSALGQTYPETEIIVVDDGSRDRSPTIIRAFGDRVRAILRQNGGMTSAINAGYEASSGDIVLFLDSDDALKPHAVAALVDAWRPGVTAMQFRLETIDGDGRPFGGIFPNFPPGRTPEQVRGEAMRSALYPCSPTSGCAYARAYLDRLMPLCPVRFPHGPDAPINAVAPLYGDVLTLDEALGYYRIHGANTWAQRAVAPEKFSGYIRDDIEKAKFFVEHAASLGIAVAPDPLRRAFFHLQYRLASLKLRPDLHPCRDDTATRLLARALTAFGVSRDRLATRLVALGWMVTLALAPTRNVAARLVELRFVGGRRPRALTSMLRHLRVTSTRGRAAKRTLSPG